MSVMPQPEQAVATSRETVMHAARVAMPRGDAMAPPELARDAPVVDVVHPLEVRLRVHLRRELDVTVAHRGDGVLRDAPPSTCGRLVDRDKPLHGEPRLDNRACALRDRQCERVVLHGDQQARGFKIGDDALARLKAIEAVIRRALKIDARLLVHDAGRGKVVALADGEVVGIVRGRHLHRAGAELGLRPVVGEDGDLAATSGRISILADERGVALIAGIYSDGGITEHGLRARGGDDDAAASIHELVANVKQVATALLVTRPRDRTRRCPARGPS